MIRESRFNDTFYYFWYQRKVGNWAVVREFIFVQSRFFEERWYDRFFESVVKVTRAQNRIVCWDSWIRFRSRLKSGEVRGCFRRRIWMRRRWCRRTTGQRQTKFRYFVSEERRLSRLRWGCINANNVYCNLQVVCLCHVCLHSIITLRLFT